MAVTQYIGARYVPLFADPLQWDASKEYEPLTIVYHQGNSYTSRQAVPTGIEINNDEFWALTGNYNAQVEQYREEVSLLDERVTTNTGNITELESDVDELETSVSGIPTLIDNTVDGKINDFRKKVQGSLALVDDWEIYAYLPEFPNAALNSIAMDTDGTLYACYYLLSGSRSVVRRFPYFEDNTPGFTPTNYRDLEITNNHCNSATIANGKLFISEFNSNGITVVDLQTFTVEDTLQNYASQIRNAAFSNRMAWIQRYNSNMLDVLFLSRETPTNLDIALGFRKPINTNYEWIQDCNVNGTAYMRVCSKSGHPFTQSYIEIYSAWIDNAPIIVPFPVNTRELEGLTSGSTYDYVSYDSNGVIVRSAQLHNIRPQAGFSINTTADASYVYSQSQFAYRNNQASGYNNTGMTYTIEDDSQNRKVFAITIPQGIWQSMNGAANGEQPLLCMKCDGVGVSGAERIGTSVSFPIASIKTQRNFVAMGNVTNGFYILNMFVSVAEGSATQDAKIYIRPVRYNEYTVNSDNVLVRTASVEDGREISFNGLQFRLAR